MKRQVEGTHHPHAHSHRRRLRGRRVWSEVELLSHQKRVERRRARQAEPRPREVRVVAVQRFLEQPPAGQQSGRFDRRGPFSRAVRDAIVRRAAALAAAVKASPSDG